MNLKDRMKSESPTSIQNGNNRMPNSENTTPKSPQPFPEQELLEKQSEAIQILQKDLRGSQEKIQQLSSENSELRSELQQKSETIVSLNEQIGKLNESDLVLQQNEQLKKQNEKLRLSEQNTRNEAAAIISSAKKKYADLQADLSSELKAAELRETEALALKKNITGKISAEANRIASNRLAVLQQDFNRKTDAAESKARSKILAVRGLTIGSFAYGIFVTLLTASRSVRCSADVLSCLNVIWLFLSGVFNLAVTAASATWTLNEHIPYRFVAGLVAGALTGIVFVLITAAIYGAVTYTVYQLCKFYKKYFWDLPSLVEALISMAIFVWFADNLSWIKWNLVIAWLVTHLLYMIVRSLAFPQKRSYYY